MNKKRKLTLKLFENLIPIAYSDWYVNPRLL